MKNEGAQLVKEELSNIPLIILAGGFGTRLSAVVKDAPKPLAPVVGKPFLHYVLQAFRDQGLEKFIFLVHHKADMMQEFIREEMEQGLLVGCDTQVVLEENPLGTGGAVANAVKMLNIQGRFLVANADTYMESGVAALCSTRVPAIAVVDVDDCSRYGAVKTQGENILRFEEKKENAGPGLINAGLYLLDGSIFEATLPEAFSMEKDIFEKLAATGGLRFAAVDTVFIDIGIPEDYHRFCRWIEQEKRGDL